MDKSQMDKIINAPIAYHIASVIVQCKPEFLEELSTKIANTPFCEVHNSDKLGKIIVVIETKTTHELSDIQCKINDLQGVYNVNMIYHETIID